jgi:hypothetical protein
MVTMGAEDKKMMTGQEIERAGSGGLGVGFETKPLLGDASRQ